MMRLFPAWLFVLVVACVPVSSARAQDTLSPAPAPDPAAPSPAPNPNALTEPKLVSLAEAGYPEEALAEKLTPAVDMLLVIGVDGYVESAELAGEPVGNGFDELALSAARRSLFDPATKGGVPMRARVRFRYQFTVPVEPEATPEPAADAAPLSREGSLEFTLLAADGNAPIANAEVLVAPASNPAEVMRFQTDAAGKLATPSLPEGAYEVSINAADFASEVHQEEVRGDEVTGLTYRLSAAKNYEEFGAVARVKAPPREVTRRTIEREELTRVAGTRGDALRTIELLPGVARPPFTAGVVLIRGSAPGDSQVLLDGVPVPILYHFGGLTSFINSRALEKIDFYPGNFSVRYGRQIGGIIDVGARDPNPTEYHGVLDVNLPLDSSLLLEGPITDKASFMVAGRRSYFGEVLGATIPDGTFDAFAAPVYYDYQSFVTWRPTDKDRIRFGVYGSSDRLEVLFSDAPDEDPSIRAIELNLQFHRQQIGWSHQYSQKLDHNMQVSFGRIDQNFSAGSAARFSLGVNNMYARAEWRYRLTPKVQITAGTDTAVDNVEVSYTGPLPGQDEGGTPGSNFSARPSLTLRDRTTQYQPSLYAEFDLRVIPKLRLVPGLRLDYFSALEQFAFDPRVAAIYSVTDTWRVKGGVGMFTQPPQPQESSPTAIGNPNLVPIKALHYSAGFEHDFTDALSLGIEGFYKNIYRRVVTPNDPEDTRRYINDGTGRIYGLEVAGRKNASGRWFGFVSYTLMRSERNDRGEGFRAFDFDQRHILTLAGTVRLGRGWELGGTFRVVTGNPQTPVNSGVNRLDTGNFDPSPGAINSIRAPTFNRLDVRAEKTWKFDKWKLAAYLDVQNAYNAENPEGVTNDFTFYEKAKIRGLPIIPIIGMRGEL